MVNCCICNRSFEPDPARLKAWAESGRSFDPTDWECPDCQNYEPEHEAMEVAGDQPVASPNRKEISNA